MTATKEDMPEGELVIDLLREFETQHLADPVHGFNNPFRRNGVPASQIAFACGLLKEGTTKSGRQRVDIPAVKRLLKGMLKAGLIEETGSQRTLACGSKSVECYALAGFLERLDRAKRDRFPDGAGSHS